MNKEQLLGRLLMNGHITIDELNILNELTIEISKPIDMYTTTSKGGHCTTTDSDKLHGALNTEYLDMFDWLDKLKKC